MHVEFGTADAQNGDPIEEQFAQADSTTILIGSIDGEKIEKIRVAAAYDGPSSLTYITASGREVPAEQFFSGGGARPAPKT